jgi:hypothetical protein
MDAYDLSDKIKKYWAVVHPKNSGELQKIRKEVKVIIKTEFGAREVVGAYIEEDKIVLRLDEE